MWPLLLCFPCLSLVLFVCYPVDVETNSLFLTRVSNIIGFLLLCSETFWNSGVVLYILYVCIPVVNIQLIILKSYKVYCNICIFVELIAG